MTTGRLGRDDAPLSSQTKCNTSLRCCDGTQIQAIHARRPVRDCPPAGRRPLDPAQEPNRVWAMDFVDDRLFEGKKIRVPTIVDTLERVARPACRRMKPEFTSPAGASCLIAEAVNTI